MYSTGEITEDEVAFVDAHIVGPAKARWGAGWSRLGEEAQRVEMEAAMLRYVVGEDTEDTLGGLLSGRSLLRTWRAVRQCAGV